MFLKRNEINMKELRIGQRVTITLEVVEQCECTDCFFNDKEGCPYLCLSGSRSDGKSVIYKEVKE